MDYSQINPPADLLPRIMNAIAIERARLRAIRRFIVASLVCAGALASSVFVWNAFMHQIALSGFWQYASLIFVDIRLVIANWQDYLMSLLESFPAMNAAGLIAEAVIIMLSVRFIFLYGRSVSAVRAMKAAARHLTYG